MLRRPVWFMITNEFWQKIGVKFSWCAKIKPRNYLNQTRSKISSLVLAKTLKSVQNKIKIRRGG
jgi:hypothetical protein